MRMSPSEAVMWAAEKDPALRSDFCNVTVLDSLPSEARLRATVEQAIVAIPRLADRVVSPPLRIAAPEWRPDPTFDVDYHIRRIAIPEPGSMRDFLDVAADHHRASARPVAPALGVHARRRARRRTGRAPPTRSTTPSPTASAACELSLSLVDLEREPGPRSRMPCATSPATSRTDRRGRSRSTTRSTATRRSTCSARRSATAPRRPSSSPSGASGAAFRHRDRSRAGCPNGRAAPVELARIAAPPGARRPTARTPRCSRRVRSARRYDVLARRPRPAPPRPARRTARASTTSSSPASPARSAAFHHEFGERPETLRMAMPVSTRGSRRLRRQPVRAEPRRGPRRDRRRRRAPARDARDAAEHPPRARARRRRPARGARRRRPDLGARRPAAGPDPHHRLRDVEPARQPGRPLPRRRPHRGQLPDGPACRRAGERDGDVVLRRPAPRDPLGSRPRSPTPTLFVELPPRRRSTRCSPTGRAGHRSRPRPRVRGGGGAGPARRRPRRAIPRGPGRARAGGRTAPGRRPRRGAASARRRRARGVSPAGAAGRRVEQVGQRDDRDHPAPAVGTRRRRSPPRGRR